MDKYSIITFCEEINLQESVKAEVFNIYEKMDWSKYEEYIVGLMSKENPFESFMTLAKQLNEDDRQMKTLTVYLECARRCLNNYQNRGIEKSIYIDTMSCFTRFIDEFHQKKGYYGFECPWWAYRQLNMSIFRLGELEFEFEDGEKGRVINIHIPSNAVFKAHNVQDSIERCKAFAHRFYPEYAEAKYTCHTWLLSPILTPLLNEDSNILQFQKMFNIIKVYNDEKHYFGFVFQTGVETPIDELKEKTSLQKKIKDLLKRSVNIGGAYGELKKY